MRRLVALSMLAAGCAVPHGYNLHGGGALLDASPAKRTCAVRPNLFASWRDPIVLPATCVSEGWVRQIVRDISDIDHCFTESREVRVELAINKLGIIEDVEVEHLASPWARGCIANTMARWQFAPAERHGDFEITYRRSVVDA